MVVDAKVEQVSGVELKRNRQGVKESDLGLGKLGWKEGKKVERRCLMRLYKNCLVV